MRKELKYYMVELIKCQCPESERDVIEFGVSNNAFANIFRRRHITYNNKQPMNSNTHIDIENASCKEPFWIARIPPKHARIRGICDNTSTFVSLERNLDTSFPANSQINCRIEMSLMANPRERNMQAKKSCENVPLWYVIIVPTAVNNPAIPATCGMAGSIFLPWIIRWKHNTVKYEIELRMYILNMSCFLKDKLEKGKNTRWKDQNDNKIIKWVKDSAAHLVEFRKLIALVLITRGVESQ